MLNCCGSRRWAEAWAAKLQPTVGTLTPDGRRITSITAQGYGETYTWHRWVPRWFGWAVVERWRYDSNSGLGEFGHECALWLDESMP
jgi:hypothetical protein